MRSSYGKKIMIVAPLLVAALGGCASTAYEADQRSGAPVVMAPANPVVVSPPPVASTVPSVPATPDRVVYQEGRWQLYGDGRVTPYYWVWIPTGATLAGTPSPPARPTSVVTNRMVTYPEGRWQLYGDGRTTQYYWVWIPAGVTPPMPPIPPQAG
jgi:hypothetical protein